MLRNKFIFLIILMNPLIAGAQFYHDIEKSQFFSESSEARWYNLETHIYQICGEDTVVNRSKNINRVEIKPNCSYILPTPPKQLLRINLVDTEGQRIPLDELFVTVGNGQGSWSEVRLFYEEETNDYILSGVTSEPQWIKFSWIKKRTQGEKAFLSIFTFRDEKVPRSAPFATQISHATEYFSKKSDCKNEIKECQCQLRSKNEVPRTKSYESFRFFNQKDSRIFWPVDPENNYWATVYGPTKIRIDSRFLVYPKEKSRSHKYFYNVYLNTAPYLTVEHESLLINSKPFYRRNTPHLLSERKSYYIDIPPGCHRLRIESIEPVYVRVLAESHDFLIDVINQKTPPMIKNKSLPLNGLKLKKIK